MPLLGGRSGIYEATNENGVLCQCSALLLQFGSALKQATMDTHGGEQCQHPLGDVRTLPSLPQQVGRQRRATNQQQADCEGTVIGDSQSESRFATKRIYGSTFT
ncbi:hypothetical protein E2C01_040112 [Portunus trituberculatus]|uniref:Uncharacterized protein n=1 Tax=Portunus trituberculatus TaxID=210409 RepID=A0A5B7FGI2_PORTR|nr:hypothetical protein [Portunus trituberculatus]